MIADVPVQYFQSVITIELAVAGALLWQMRYFEPRDGRRDSARLPDPLLRLGIAFVMGATIFGALWAMADEGAEMGSDRGHARALDLAGPDSCSSAAAT